MIEWPYQALPAPEVNWRPEGLWISASSIGNRVSRTETSNGGRWLADMTVPLSQSRRLSSGVKIRQLNLMRALLGQLKRNVPMIVRTCECNFAPWPEGGPSGETTYSDGTVHSDGTPFAGGGGISATAAADAAADAWEIQLDAIVMGDLIGGEAFSIDHPSWGVRRYEIAAIDSDVLTLNMPLREAVTAGTALDFNRPGCVMKCLNPESAMSAIRMGRFADLTIQFEETWDI